MHKTTLIPNLFTEDMITRLAQKESCYVIMNKRHRRTLNAIFAQSISDNIKWRDVEALLKALGAIISERAGSRVGVRLSAQIAVFHRPHPSPNMDKGAVRDVRRFLENVGITP